jgi:hypothetical protein
MRRERPMRAMAVSRRGRRMGVECGVPLLVFSLVMLWTLGIKADGV